MTPAEPCRPPLLFSFSPWWPLQDNCGSVASFLRSAASSSGLPRDLDDVTIPDFSDVSCLALAGGRGCDVGVTVLLCLPVFCLFFPVVPSFLCTPEPISDVVNLSVDCERFSCATLLFLSVYF